MTSARREIEQIESEQPGIRPPIVQSLWHVPPKWFVCFDDAERRMEHSGDHPSIRYETRRGVGPSPCSCALDTLTGGIVHPVIVGHDLRAEGVVAGFDERWRP